MEKISCIIFITALFGLFSFIHGKAEEEILPDGQMKTKITFPKLTEEETDSSFIPDHMKCDGCKAVAFQLFIGLAKAEAKFKKTKKPLPESEYLDVFDSVCNGEAFDQYGLKDVDGQNMLSGPGIEKEASGPAAMQGGGKWPGRLKNICTDFIDERGDDEIYKAFRELKGFNDFEKYLCLGPDSKFCKEKKSKEEL